MEVDWDVVNGLFTGNFITIDINVVEIVLTIEVFAWKWVVANVCTGIVLSLKTKNKIMWVLDKSYRLDYRIYQKFPVIDMDVTVLLQVHQYPYHSSVHQEQNVPPNLCSRKKYILT